MIYWMPHAQSEGLPDGDLSTLGYNQAHKAGVWLAEKTIHSIRHSTDSEAERTAEIITRVLEDADAIPDRRLNVVAHAISRATLLTVSKFLDDTEAGTLVISRPDSLLDVLPRLCVNAAALQRVSTPHPTGLILLERYSLRRYTCHAWDLREHLR